MTTKGYCDENLAKAEEARDFRFSDTKSLALELRRNQATKDALEVAIQGDTDMVKKMASALKVSNVNAGDRKIQLQACLKEQQQGLVQIEEAIVTLKKFYTQAAKAGSASFVQKSYQETHQIPRRPTRAARAERREQARAERREQELGGRDQRRGELRENAESGAKGVYTGKQGGVDAIMGLLETIASDFDREIRKMNEELDQSKAKRNAASDALGSQKIGAEELRALDLQELSTTKISIKVTTDNLQNAADLLDASLKELDSLKPICVNSGMSYSDRVKQRELEMAALGRALTLLTDPLKK